MFPDERKYVTPFLPPQAEKDVAAWRAKGRLVLVWAFEQMPRPDCRNCQGHGIVVVTFCRAGPFRSVPDVPLGESCTWFDGSARFGRGWYIIASHKTGTDRRTGEDVTGPRTVSYPCPACRGDSPPPGEPTWKDRLEAAFGEREPYWE